MLTDELSTYSRFGALQFIQLLTALAALKVFHLLLRRVRALNSAENVAPKAARIAMIINMQHKPTAYSPSARQRVSHMAVLQIKRNLLQDVVEKLEIQRVVTFVV